MELVYTSNVPDRLKFEKSTIPEEHSDGDVIENLNVLFLQEFFKKLKSQISPGFDNRNLKTNQKNFIINSDSFYKTKGTDLSYKILFKALFGETVDIIRPSQFLFRPSDATYSVTQDIVVKKDIGDPLDLQSLTLFQNSSGARGTVTQYLKFSMVVGIIINLVLILDMIKISILMVHCMVSLYQIPKQRF